MTHSDHFNNELFDLVHVAASLEEAIARFIKDHTAEIIAHANNENISVEITLKELHSALKGATNHLGSLLLEQIA